jgi:hypothetical protein
LALFFVPEEPGLGDQDLALLLRRLGESLAKTLGLAADCWLPLERGQVPKTAIGKIQRKLLAHALESGEFDAVLKRADRLLGNRRTLPDWFYRKAWRLRESNPDGACVGESYGSCMPYEAAKAANPAALREKPGLALVFADTRGLADGLEQVLAASGKTVVRVEAGEGFAALPGGGYRVAPEEPGDYLELLAALAGRPLAQIWHLWDYGPYAFDEPHATDPALNQSLHSLLALAQALAANPRPKARLYVAASHAQQVTAGEPVAYEKTAALGLLKSVAAELPWLRCRHIDLEPAEASAHAASLLAESLSPAHEAETAWRAGKRWVARLEKVRFARKAAPVAAFRRGGLYLLSGGLGGLGAEIAAFLLERYAAKLVLLG